MSKEVNCLLNIYVDYVTWYSLKTFDYDFFDSQN